MIEKENFMKKQEEGELFTDHDHAERKIIPSVDRKHPVN
jgi:hypothetical protein